MRRPSVAAIAVFAFLVPAIPATARPPQVLRVGSFHGVAGQFGSIQAAVDAARPGDWVLVGPGDYKTSASRAPKSAPTMPAAVLITTPRLYLRGMNRNTVVVDGTKSASAKCSSQQPDQNFGPAGSGGALGLNGIEIYRATDVWVQNLTTCNFLGGTGDAGNQIWWNGGADSGQVGGHQFYGSYLTATSTFFASEATAATYGIFSSNWDGGTWDHTYASNFNDSAYYIGACQQICNQVVNHAHGEYSVLGYSGSNSGGSLVVKNSEFDNNQDGFDTNSQNGDNPSPQNGACPGNAISPITHTHSCWVFMHNYVHDNNNPNVPSAGLAAAGPVGTGMSVSGGRNDTIMNNRFENNNAWGLIFVPFIDSGPPCTAGTQNLVLGCVFDEWGDALIGNSFSHNGSYGHPSNGDFAQLNIENGHPSECYSGNSEAGGGPLTPDAAKLQATHPTCTTTPVPARSSNPQFLTEVLCDSQVRLLPPAPAICPTGQYPRLQQVQMHPLPTNLATMASPCAGVPSDPWCSGQMLKVAGCAAATVSLPLSLAVGERFTSVTVKVGARKTKFAANGRTKRIRVGLGSGRHHKVRMGVIERIKVGSHRETIRFTRVYRRC